MYVCVEVVLKITITLVIMETINCAISSVLRTLFWLSCLSLYLYELIDSIYILICDYVLVLWLYLVLYIVVDYHFSSWLLVVIKMMLLSYHWLHNIPHAYGVESHVIMMFCKLFNSLASSARSSPTTFRWFKWWITILTIDLLWWQKKIPS